MIELTNVTKQYKNVAVLKNITLTIDRPGIYCLLGRNGAGKTTLLKSIAGLSSLCSTAMPPSISASAAVKHWTVTGRTGRFKKKNALTLSSHGGNIIFQKLNAETSIHLKITI